MGTQGKSLAFYQGSTFDKNAWFKIASRDYEALINAYDFQSLLCPGGGDISLLDLGCGTGKFPAMLASQLQSENKVQCDLLDPSSESLKSCAESLEHPFQPAQNYQCFFETMAEHIPADQKYDVIWSIQSLYCADASVMKQTLKTVSAHLNENGHFLIYIGALQSSYIKIHSDYLDNHGGADDQPYVHAQDIENALSGLPVKTQIFKQDFTHDIPADDKALLCNYLNQCAFTDRDLSEWMAMDNITAYMESYRDGNMYRLPQSVWLFDVTSL